MQEKITRAKVADLIQDDQNFNKGTEKGQKLLKTSLARFGAGRSILLDKNGRIMAGNKTQENALELGMEDVIIVETDGTKLVAVKRTDVDLDTKEGREMALADNATTEANLDWNRDVLKSQSEKLGFSVEEWGLAPWSQEVDETYSRKIDAPIYEPSGKAVDLSQLCDSSKTDTLIKEIDQAKIPLDVKKFLKYAAHRHTEFNYELIADYYASAPKEVQALFEKSALVIIDFGQAIEQGFVRMSNELLSEYKNEYGENDG